MPRVTFGRGSMVPGASGREPRRAPIAENTAAPSSMQRHPFGSQPGARKCFRRRRPCRGGERLDLQRRSARPRAIARRADPIYGGRPRMPYSKLARSRKPLPSTSRSAPTGGSQKASSPMIISQRLPPLVPTHQRRSGRRYLSKVISPGRNAGGARGRRPHASIVGSDPPADRHADVPEDVASRRRHPASAARIRGTCPAVTPTDSIRGGTRSRASARSAPGETFAQSRARSSCTSSRRALKP